MVTGEPILTRRLRRMMDDESECDAARRLLAAKVRSGLSSLRSRVGKATIEAFTNDPNAIRRLSDARVAITAAEAYITAVDASSRGVRAPSPFAVPV